MRWDGYVCLLALRLLTVSIDMGLCRPSSCSVGSAADSATTAPGEACARPFRRQASSSSPAQDQGTTTTTTEVTTFVYYFEGVDYTIHYRYEDLHKDRNDCESLYIWCVRRGTTMHHVCGYNYYQGRYYSYYSVCEIEIYNCLFRITEKNWGVYGTHHTNDPVFYNGESKRCEFYYRRARSPEEMDYLYFGGNKEEVLANWRAQNRAQEKLAKQVSERGLEAIIEDEEDSQGEQTHGMGLHAIPETGQREQLDMTQDGNGTEDDGMEQNELDETERDQMELEQMVQDGNNMHAEIEREEMDQGEIVDENISHYRMGQINMVQDKMGVEAIRGREIEQEDIDQPESEFKKDEKNEMERLHKEFERKMQEKNTKQGGNYRQEIIQGETVRENFWENGRQSMWQDKIGQKHVMQDQSGIGQNGYGKDGMMQRGTGVVQTGQGAIMPPGKVLSGMRYLMQQYRGMGQNGRVLNEMGQNGIRQGGNGDGMWQGGMRPVGMHQQTMWRNNMGQRGVGQGHGLNGIGQEAMGQSGIQYVGMIGQNSLQYQPYGIRG